MGIIIFKWKPLNPVQNDSCLDREALPFKPGIPLDSRMKPREIVQTLKYPIFWKIMKPDEI